MRRYFSAASSPGTSRETENAHAPFRRAPVPRSVSLTVHRASPRIPSSVTADSASKGVVRSSAVHVPSVAGNDHGGGTVIEPTTRAGTGDVTAGAVGVVGAKGEHAETPNTAADTAATRSVVRDTGTVLLQGVWDATVYLDYLASGKHANARTCSRIASFTARVTAATRAGRERRINSEYAALVSANDFMSSAVSVAGA